jgi:hypothetical protein
MHSPTKGLHALDTCTCTNSLSMVSVNPQICLSSQKIVKDISSLHQEVITSKSGLLHCVNVPAALEIQISKVSI